MPQLTSRSRETELMDQGGFSFAEFRHCLRSLEIINQLTLAYRPTLRWLRNWTDAEEPLCILDAGSGGGDMLRRIARQAGETVSLIGVDLNPWSKQCAELSATAFPVRFVSGDIFGFEPDQPIDIIVCSLFTHHLSDAQLVDFLRWIDGRAEKAWFISDLHRHPIPYYFIKTATRLLSRNRLIRNDAAVSVARSFTVDDWQRLLSKAGLGDRVDIEWFFPFRLCLSRRQSADSVQRDV